jgi:ribosomal-protein-alanine N-acetyltransferase
MVEIGTARMRLVSGTGELAEAELESRSRLARLLRGKVTEEWPPESVRDVLPCFMESFRAGSAEACWALPWYGLLRTDEEDVLCGSIGFKGPPDGAGVVEVGYSVLPEYAGREIATGMLAAVTEWAKGNPKVRAIEAETLPDNMASIRVLEKVGFIDVGPGRERGTVRFRLVAP